MAGDRRKPAGIQRDDALSDGLFALELFGDDCRAHQLDACAGIEQTLDLEQADRGIVPIEVTPPPLADLLQRAPVFVAIGHEDLHRDYVLWLPSGRRPQLFTDGWFLIRAQGPLLVAHRPVHFGSRPNWNAS